MGGVEIGDKVCVMLQLNRKRNRDDPDWEELCGEVRFVDEVALKVWCDEAVDEAEHRHRMERARTWVFPWSSVRLITFRSEWRDENGS